MTLRDPNSTSLNETSTPPQPCCVRLRSKSMSYRPDERPGLVHWSDTQTYWCSETMDPVGPDDAAVSPKVCQLGRTCFCGQE